MGEPRPHNACFHAGIGEFHGVLWCLTNFDYGDVMVIYILLLHQLWRCLQNISLIVAIVKTKHEILEGARAGHQTSLFHPTLMVLQICSSCLFFLTQSEWIDALNLPHRAYSPTLCPEKIQVWIMMAYLNDAGSGKSREAT